MKPAPEHTSSSHAGADVARQQAPRRKQRTPACFWARFCLQKVGSPPARRRSSQGAGYVVHGPYGSRTETKMKHFPSLASLSLAPISSAGLQALHLQDALLGWL